MYRINSLDSLRAMAVILVVLGHIPFGGGESTLISILMGYSWIGVELFFILSGYLISKKLFIEFSKNQRISFFNFYLKRAFRILPSYYAVLFLYFYFESFREYEAMQPLWKFLTFTLNFDHYYSTFSHAWSLCVEEHFYLILPVFVMLFIKHLNLKKLIFVVAFFTLAGVIGRGFIWQTIMTKVENPSLDFSFLYYKYLYYPSYARYDSLLLGVIVSLIQNYFPKNWKYLQDRYIGCFILGIGSFGIGIYLFSGLKTFWSASFGYFFLAFGLSFLLITSLSTKSLFYRIKIPGFRFIALISYSLYLVHKAILKLAHEKLVAIGFNQDEILYYILLLSLVGASGALLYFCIELPFLKLREKLLS